jgi:NADPH:quinone reductase-like Zn-dependent oxidoreductase
MRRPVLGFAVVRGQSMQPTLRPGDRLLVRYGGRPRAGRLAVVRLPHRPIGVKRVRRRVSDGWDVRSDNTLQGSDSRVFGPVPDADVIGVVLCRIWPPRLGRRTAARR